MKNLLLGAFILISSTLSAQKNFEGIITYDITLEGTSVSAEDRAKTPKELITYYKDGKMRMEVVTPQLSFVVLTDATTQSATFLMEIKEMMGMKLALQTTKDEVKTKMNISSSPNITYLNEKKTIVGYQCSKVKISTTDGNINAYITKTLEAEGINWILDESIKGTMLAFTISSSSSDERLTLQAREVSKTNIPPSKFNIPSDYMVISAQDAENMFDEEFPL